MVLFYLTDEEIQERSSLSEDNGSILSYAENLFLILNIHFYEKYTGQDDIIFIEMQRTNKSITLKDLQQFYHLLRRDDENIFPAIVASLPDSYHIRVVVDSDGGKFQDYDGGAPYWHDQSVSVTSPYMNCSISSSHEKNVHIPLRVIFPFVVHDKVNDEFNFPMYVGVDLKSERSKNIYENVPKYPLPPLPGFIKDVNVRVADNLTFDNYRKDIIFSKRRGGGIASSKKNKVHPMRQRSAFTTTTAQRLTPESLSASLEDVVFDIQRSRSLSGIPGQMSMSRTSSNKDKSTQFNDLPHHLVDKIKDELDDVKKLYFSVAQGIDETRKSIKRLSSKHNAIISYAKLFSFILGHHAPCQPNSDTFGHGIVMEKTNVSLNFKEYRRLTNKIFTFTDWWYTWGLEVGHDFGENDFSSLHTEAPITPLIGEDSPSEYNVHVNQHNYFYDDDSDGVTCELEIHSQLLPCVHTETIDEYYTDLYRTIRRKTPRTQDLGATIGSFELIALRLMFPIAEHDGSDWQFPMYVAVQYKYYKGDPPPPLSIPPLPHIVLGVQLRDPNIMQLPRQWGGRKKRATPPKRKTHVKKKGVVRGRNPC
jgi:hypothetical protein